ncbi:unnamed protein product, partial [Gulo gulo]
MPYRGQRTLTPWSQKVDMPPDLLLPLPLALNDLTTAPLYPIARQSLLPRPLQTPDSHKLSLSP